jgi:hypothetical protein
MLVGKDDSSVLVLHEKKCQNVCQKNQKCIILLIMCGEIEDVVCSLCFYKVVYSNSIEILDIKNWQSKGFLGWE